MRGDEPPARPRGASHRLVFIDNLRWSAIAMVVVIHAAVTYSGLGSWYVRDLSGTSRALVIGLGTYQTFQHSVAMGLLFGIAGYFARASIGRKGAVAFLRERAFRLGLPLLLYMLVVGPATQFFLVGAWGGTPAPSFAAEWLRHLGNGAVFSESGPLWFCLVLLVLSAGYALLHAVMPVARLGERPVPGVVAVLGYGGLMALLAFATGLATAPGSVVLNVELHDLPQYPLMFAAGVMAQRHDWLRRLPSRSGRAWGLGGLLAGTVGWVLLISQGGALHGHLRDYFGGWHWQAAAMDLWRAGMCLSLTLGLVTLYRDRFDGQGPAARFLARNAFGVYVFHPPILIAITQVLRHWPLDAAVKFLVASVFAVTATFLFVGTVARRMPGIRAIL